MIKLKDILEQLDYGDKLWADPLYATLSPTHKQIIQQLYKGETEPDTNDEKELFQRIKAYIKSGKWPEGNLNALDDLLQLKSKFPQILDPKDQVQDNKVYRGMTAHIDQVKELIKLSSQQSPWKWEGWTQLTINNTLHSRNKSGYLSYTTDPNTATNFATRLGDNKGGKQWPIVPVVLYNIIQHRAVLNPKYLEQFLGGFSHEYEFLVKGNDIPAQSILVYNMQGLPR